MNDRCRPLEAGDLEDMADQLQEETEPGPFTPDPSEIRGEVLECLTDIATRDADAIREGAPYGGALPPVLELAEAEGDMRWLELHRRYAWCEVFGPLPVCRSQGGYRYGGSCKAPRSVGGRTRDEIPDRMPVDEAFLRAVEISAHASRGCCRRWEWVRLRLEETGPDDDLVYRTWYNSQSTGSATVCLNGEGPKRMKPRAASHEEPGEDGLVPAPPGQIQVNYGRLVRNGKYKKTAEVKLADWSWWRSDFGDGGFVEEIKKVRNEKLVPYLCRALELPYSGVQSERAIQQTLL